MKTSIRHSVKASVIVLIAGTSVGCFTAQNTAVMEAMEKVAGKGGGSGSPVVEAYLEYAGAREDWAGPGSVLVHIVSRETGDAQIQVSGLGKDWPAQEEPSLNMTGGRRPAQAIDMTEGTARSRVGNPEEAAKSGAEGGGMANGVTKITAEQARADLAALAQAAEAQESGHACAYTVKLRMVRLDGSVFEKQDCRSQRGWVGMASQLMERWVTASR